MFTVDVLSLRQFYASLLGQQAQRAIFRAMMRIWPEYRAGEQLMVLGYGFPYLQPMQESGVKLLPMMLANHGAIYWPPEGDNRSILLKDKYLPLADNALDRVLLVHALEHSRNITQTLDELWRVMSPGAKLLLVVPNRRSMWAQAASTPFGCGQPFTVQQLARKLEERHFTYLGSRSALHTLPLTWRWVNKLAKFMEALGEMFFPFAGGVILVEAEKQIYAAMAQPVKEARDKTLYPIVSPVVSKTEA